MFNLPVINDTVHHVRVNVFTRQITFEEVFNLFVMSADNEILYSLNNKPYPIEVCQLVIDSLNLKFVNPASENNVIFVNVSKKAWLGLLSIPTHDLLRNVVKR